MRQGFLHNGKTKLHYIEYHSDIEGKTPLLICPGLSEPAENYLEVMEALEPRRIIALSYRGRGKSDSPESGYSLEHHVSDIETVIQGLNLNDFAIMGYSRGVSYALGYATKHPQSIKSLIIAEYPAQHKKMPDGWADEYLSTYWGNDLGANLLKAHVVRAIQKESHQVEFAEELHNLYSKPTLVMRGVLEESLLSKEQADIFSLYIASTTLTAFENSGHTLKNTEFNKFVTEINTFLKQNEL